MKMNIFIRIRRKSVDHSFIIYTFILINEEEGRELEYE
jgi:hypothetical protein